MTAPKLYRKKPVEVEAMQWDCTDERFVELQNWGGADTFVLEYVATNTGGGDPRWFDRLSVRTLEGPMAASEGDWIIRGIQGEFYPCKPDIFAATYEAVES